MLTVTSYLNGVTGNVCGTVELIDTRILSGMQTKRGEYPFLAALFYTEQSKFFCAGTLISTKHVLTAAHCVQQKQSRSILQPEDVVVLLGKYNLTRIERGAAQKDVQRIFIHPDWKVFNDKYDADIAIFELADLVDYSNLIRPICLPDLNETIEDVEATIAGWGLAEHTLPNSHEPVPQQTTTYVFNASYCLAISPQFLKSSSTRVFCGGGQGGEPNSGDSGGGLFIRTGYSWVQYGIISSSLSDGSGQRLPNYFSLYTSVPRHMKWIQDTVQMSGGAVTSLGDEPIDNIDIYCSYAIDAQFYRCVVRNASISKPNVRVVNFEGKHLTDYSDELVTEIWFWIGKLSYFPDGIGELYKKLEKITVSFSDRNLGLKLLQRRNFRNMPHLWYLTVYHNEIEFVDEDSFRDLPSLNAFSINNNKIKVLHKSTFSRNPKLEVVIADSNELEFLHKELFKNNPLLKRVSFKSNKLKTIPPDFTTYNHITEVDFSNNTCIKEAWFKADHLNLTEYQGLLTLHCT